MFCIQIADLSIGIDNRYPYVGFLCQDYKTDRPPLFTVRASEEEIRREAAAADPGSAGRGKGYYESLCIYRNLCNRLPDYDAFLMHGAAIAVDGAAYVFCAPSGTGKTTHIRLWQQQFGQRARVINGDKPVLRFIDGVLYACGTPWNGKERLGCNARCPVAGICFLEQGAENRIRRLAAREVTERIFHQVLLPPDQPTFDRFWALLDRLLQTTPMYLLQCNPKPEAALLAYQTMRGDLYAENQARFPAAEAGR